ncbi:unnamed protein product [Trichobilharzia regenti]|nr:unnamed protein product [Trichobilharzia regenti]
MDRNTNRRLLLKLEFKQLLLLCTKNKQFQFNDKIYCPIDEVAIGGQMVTVLSNIFTARVGQTKLGCTADKTIAYCKYLDFTFILRNDLNNACQMLGLFSNIHESITFTMEHKDGGISA